jgi:CubicO group peptidase (beta-lactamase class C family)
MRTIRFLIIAANLCLSCTDSTDVSPQVPRQDERTRKVDELFSRWDTAQTPGAVVAIINDGEIIYRQAYGMADLERDVPLSVQSVFDIASTSKQFVAMSILLLRECGDLSLNDDIRRYLPELPDYGETITIQHLIHHSSGIRDYMDLMYLAGMKHENSYHPSEIIDLVARQRMLSFKPGDEFLYSNSGYLLLGEIIERVSGQTLGQFTNENIFEPLGMNVSHFYDDFMRIVKHRALSYSQKKPGGYASIQYIFDVVGDTGLLTNIDDLFRWDQNFYHNKLAGGSPKLIEQMLTAGQLNSGEKLDYAFGLEIEKYRGLTLIKHGGSAAGYRSEMLRFPDQKFSVIVLSNLAEFEPTVIAEKVADLYLGEAYTDSSAPVSTTPKAPETARPEADPNTGPSELDGHPGHYYSAELDATYVVLIVDGKLRYRVASSPMETQLASTGRDEWHAEDITLSFQRDSTGAVTGLSVSSGRIRDIYFSKTR